MPKDPGGRGGKAGARHNLIDTHPGASRTPLLAERHQTARYEPYARSGTPSVPQVLPPPSSTLPPTSAPVIAQEPRALASDPLDRARIRQIQELDQQVRDKNKLISRLNATIALQRASPHAGDGRIRNLEHNFKVQQATTRAREETIRELKKELAEELMIAGDHVSALEEQLEKEKEVCHARGRLITELQLASRTPRKQDKKDLQDLEAELEEMSAVIQIGDKCLQDKTSQVEHAEAENQRLRNELVVRDKEIKVWRDKVYKTARSMTAQGALDSALDAQARGTLIAMEELKTQVREKDEEKKAQIRALEAGFQAEAEDLKAQVQTLRSKIQEKDEALAGYQKMAEGIREAAEAAAQKRGDEVKSLIERQKSISDRLESLGTGREHGATYVP